MVNSVTSDLQCHHAIIIYNREADVGVARERRDHICDLLGLARPVKKVSKETTKKSQPHVSDEMASYRGQSVITTSIQFK